jgi:ATP-dependent DNA ligase
VNGGGAELFSRRELRYRKFADLCSEISLDLNADDAVLDGEIVKLDESGRPVFLDLMRRRGPFQFAAFDVLALNGKDVQQARAHGSQALAPQYRAEALEVDPLRTTSKAAAGTSSQRSATRTSRGSSRSGRARPTTLRRR